MSAVAREYGPCEAARELGSRLGLYIVKMLVMAIAGRMEVKSALEQGSAFRVLLLRENS